MIVSLPETLTRTSLTLLSLVAFSLCFQSCAFRPAIDEKGKVSVRQPNKLMRNHGFYEFERIKRNKSTSTDPRYIKPLERVANRLKKVIEMPGAEWEFVVFRDNSPNAFALPGGKVGVNTGLFHLIGNDRHSEALLAAVLGHEISHATANHAEHRMYRGVLLGALSALLWSSLEHNQTDHPEHAVLAFGAAYYLCDSLPFSRKQEYESDKIGAVYMAQAGYDPRESIELWRRLKSYHIRQGGQKPEFLRTHPLDDARITALEEFMPIALRYYSKYSPKKK